MNESPRPTLTPEQQRLNDLCDEHVRDEFATRDPEATLATMVPDAYVNHVPVMTGGVGRDALRDFYSRLFIPQMPPGSVRQVPRPGPPLPTHQSTWPRRSSPRRPRLRVSGSR